MIRKIIGWTFFSVFSLICITWLSTLVFNAAKTESMRWGAKMIRAQMAQKARGPIYIGVAGGLDGDEKSLLNGVTMALDEINGDKGVLGRPVAIVPKDDQTTITTGMRVAQDFADRLDVVAVIGHTSSMVSLSTAVIYEYYGLLMLSPLSTNPALTRQGRKLVFRTIPTDEADGVTLADYAAAQKYKRVVIYYLQDDYSRGLANIFESRCYDLDISIVDRIAYESTYKVTDIATDINQWKRQFTFDAILLAGLLPQAGEVIAQIRKAGITVPVLCGNSMDDEILLNSFGNTAENTVVVSSFDPASPQAQVQQFVKAYTARYRTTPDLNAAQGYDALKLLAHVIKEGNSTVPQKMAETLRNVKNWQGVTGPHTMNEQGDVVGKPMVLKVVRNGKFETVQ